MMKLTIFLVVGIAAVFVSGQTTQCTTVADCTTCATDETATCHHDGTCHCHHTGGQGPTCTTEADCTCGADQTAQCAHGHCHCHHNHGKRETVACTNATTCDTHCAPNIGECKHDKCHCHHEAPALRAHCTTAVDCSCPHGTVAECDAHHQCQCKHDNGHPVGRRQVMCHNNSECSAHCSPHIGTCTNNKCHCHQH
ncbi:uncharacterized protein [Mytilus edulis]|uniref:uncharacterized protein n=1 Tax=Mytilus edulis TaxID=6550 RepID=UPI0039EEAFD7